MSIVRKAALYFTVSSCVKKLVSNKAANMVCSGKAAYVYRYCQASP